MRCTQHEKAKRMQHLWTCGAISIVRNVREPIANKISSNIAENFYSFHKSSFFINDIHSKSIPFKLFIII